MEKINLINHYKKLWFYSLHRGEHDNYQKMREYFAQVLIIEIEEFMPLWDKNVLDVGGAKGVFCKVLNERRRCDATNLDPYPGKYIWPKTKIGFADNIPFDDNKFDLVICRGVLEHIPTEKQQKSVNEMHRVLKEKGICYIMIPPWYNPHAGHGLKPFHILPFKVGKFLRELIFKNKIETTSLAEEGLYPITFRKMLKMISNSDFKILDIKNTHFRLHFLTKIPLIREIMVPAAAFILTKEKNYEKK